VYPGAAICNGIQQWQAAFAYVAGNQVIYNGQLYTAVQWTYDNAPPSHPDQWVFGGACGQPINNKANCNGVAAWQSNVAYTAGNDVTYQNHLWAAVQWTEANSPGDASGLWKDLGACA
jgi:chitodextrinase